LRQLRGSLKKAIEASLPDTSVKSDPTPKLVPVRDSTDMTAIKALVTEAGHSDRCRPLTVLGATGVALAVGSLAPKSRR
jgi:hypothetical protein